MVWPLVSPVLWEGVCAADVSDPPTTRWCGLVLHGCSLALMLLPLCSRYVASYAAASRL